MVHHLIAALVNRPRRTADLLLESAPGGMIRNSIKGTSVPHGMPGLIEDTRIGKVKAIGGPMEGHAHFTRRAEHSENSINLSR
jgi:hypothetical protein